MVSDPDTESATDQDTDPVSSINIEGILTLNESPSVKSPQMKRTIDSAINLLGSKQDMVYTTQSENKWIMVVFDGHGNNIIPDLLKTLIDSKIIDLYLSKDFFSEDDNPAICMQQYFAEQCKIKNLNALNSGTTMVISKIEHIGSEIHVDIFSIGDSKSIVYCNNEIVYETIPHTYNNLDEIARLRRENRLLNPEEPTHEDKCGFDLLSENVICGKFGRYVDFKTYYSFNPLSLAPTQSLGHLELVGNKIHDVKGICGIAPCVKHLVFLDSDEINVKIFSDGVSDVINGKIIASDEEFFKTSNAKETVERASKRWQQNWKECCRYDYFKSIKHGTSFEHIIYNFEKDADDVSCASWIQTIEKY